MRIKQRKFGRTTEGAATLGATNVIKIGHSDQMVKNGIKHKVPKKDGGFRICRNQPDDATGNMLVDYEAMERLGCDRKTINDSMQAGIKGRGLPDLLNFYLTCDSDHDGEHWNHGSTYSEQFECWDKIGLWCRGDGETARRRLKGGGEEVIQCRPLGVNGLSPEKCCPYSKDKKCKTCGKLACGLFTPGVEGEAPQPLDSRIKFGALYKFETTGEYSLMQILNHLDQTAGRVRGRMGGLTGVLIFGVKKRRTGNEKCAVGEVGMVSMHIDEMAIQAREQMMHDRLVEENRSRVHLLDAPDELEKPRDVEAETVDPEEPKAAAWDEGEPTDAPSTDLASAHEWDAYDLAGKSLEQILLALDRYIDEEVEATGMIWEEASEKVLWFEHENRPHGFASTDHFRDPNISDRQREQRFRAAQAIAQRLLDDPESGFFIQDPGA